MFQERCQGFIHSFLTCPEAGGRARTLSSLPLPRELTGGGARQPEPTVFWVQEGRVKEGHKGGISGPCHKDCQRELRTKEIDEDCAVERSPVENMLGKEQSAQSMGGRKGHGVCPEVGTEHTVRQQC